MADSNSRKRKADSGVRPDVDDDVDADGPLADGNAGLTGDGTRDLGEMNYGDSGDDEENEQEYDDDNQMEEQEEDDDDEDEEEMGSSEGEEVGSSSNVEQNPSRKRAAGISKEVFIPGRDAIAEGETLQMDPSAYVMYHAWTADASCLSFDVMPDRQGPARTKFPLTATIVAGTQAESSNANKLLVMRLSNLCKTQEGADDDDDDSIDDEDNEDPVVEAQRIPHPGAVNRVRVMPQEPHVVATWSETGRVLLWDTRPQVRVLEALAAGGGAATAGAGAASTLRPVCNFAGHTQEGWALDWSTVQPGRLATGGCDGRIHILDPDQAKAQAAVRAAPGEGDLQAVWSTDVTPYKGQKGSIEDLQWSPNEGTVFASCGTDGTVRIWDSRVKDKSMLHVAGAEAGVDVNVLSWSRRVAFLLASGDDKGGFKVWDLRSFKSESPIASFTWHSGPLYALEWDPQDENCLVAASGDGTVTLWDMSLEADDEAEAALGAGQGKEGKVVPPQLLFIHAGQEDVREAHFHPQLPGVVLSCASDGLNVWKPDVITTT